MVGRLQSDFRKGNLAEALGVLLLKGIAAVAEVNHQEDVGIDAIGTLLRLDEDENQYAEESFVVQLKSESVNSIKYDDHALQWFLNQSQPMFIGRVSLQNAEISLYPTVFVTHAVMALHSKQVVIRFGESGLPTFLRGQEWSPWRADSDDHDKALVWLGQPIMRWNMSDIADRNWSQQAYSVLKKFIMLERRERELNLNGQSSIFNWLVNDAASIKVHSGLSGGGPDDLPAIADRAASGFLAIAKNGSVLKDKQSRMKLLLALNAVVSTLRECDIDIDPDGRFGMFLHVAATTPDGDLNQRAGPMIPDSPD